MARRLLPICQWCACAPRQDPMEPISSLSAVSGVSDPDVVVARAAQVLIFRLGRDPEVLRTVVEMGRKEFFRVARAELHGYGLSGADLERVLQIIRRNVVLKRDRRDKDAA
jgi:hypothetical protein